MGNVRRELVHRMGRRSVHNDYSTPGIYHITLKVAQGLRQPLGRVVGRLDVADGDPEAPHVALTEIGRMVERELTHSIHAHYGMVEVQEHVVMPDHLHAIVVVRSDIVSSSGGRAHLGQVIAGFKKGCNRRYWEMTGQEDRRGKPAGAERAPSRGTTGRQPLFGAGYVDVMPLQEGQLQQQKEYIRHNPRSRLLRSTHRDRLQVKRMSIRTALTPAALRGYLLREHALRADDDASGGNPLARKGQTGSMSPLARKGGAGSTSPLARLMVEGGYVCCDSYGDSRLLGQRLLPVVCHRKDRALFSEQKAACMAAAAQGAVLVSARIAQGEQEIMDEAVRRGFPIVHVVDNGFPPVYHPSEQRIDLCARGLLLVVTPWSYGYRYAEGGVSVVECKAMNCVVQALCRMRDSWWQ